MNLLNLRQLTPSRQEQLETLVRLCRDYEGIRLSCPLDADCFYLLEDKEGRLASALCIYEDMDLPECRAFTLPSCRRQGYFRQLLDQFESELGEGQMVFAADPKGGDGLKTLEAIGASLWYEEYAMALELSGRPVPKGSLRPLRLRISRDPEDQELLSVLAEDGIPVGSCRLALSGSSCCLFSFEIRPGRRGGGLGYSFLQKLLARLSLEGISSMTLQVSGQNHAALSLYKKTGFRIRDTLSYYLY